MADFDPMDLAYAAGIIDGEGYIGIYEMAPKKERRSPQFRVRLCVAMTDPIVPLWLAETFGGTAHTYEGRKAGHRPQTHWVLQGRGALEALIELLPWLRVKHAQAETVIDYYLDPRLDWSRRGNRGKRAQIPDAELEVRREYVSVIQGHNKRGGSVPGGDLA